MKDLVYFLSILMIAIMCIIPVNNAGAQAMLSDNIQNELSNICNIRLGQSSEDVRVNRYIRFMNNNSGIESYVSNLMDSQIENVPVYREFQLGFYQNKLYTVSFTFNSRNKHYLEALKDVFTDKLGEPTSVVSRDYMSPGEKSYEWYDDKIHISLMPGLISFLDVELSKKANQISLKQYAEMLRNDSNQRSYLEERVKSDPEYKKQMKESIDANDSFKQALIDGGIDMSIFD